MPFVHHAMFLLMSMPLPLAEGASSPKVDSTREASPGNVTARAADDYVAGSLKPQVMLVAQRQYQAPEIAYGKFVLAVRRSSSMRQVLYMLSKRQQDDLKVQQEKWPNVKKWRLEYQKQDRKAGRTDRASRDPRYLRSPYENELQSLKDTVDNVVDVKSCEIEGNKATLKVLTKGDVVKNGRELYRTETVTMVKENGRWLYSHTRTGSVAIGFY